MSYIRTLPIRGSVFHITANALQYDRDLYTFNAGYVPTSVEAVQIILERKMPLLPKLNMPCIDIRDVATAHVIAMTLPDAAGHRHILSNTYHWLPEIGQILAQEFSSQGYKPVTVSIIA